MTERQSWDGQGDKNTTDHINGPADFVTGNNNMKTVITLMWFLAFIMQRSYAIN